MPKVGWRGSSPSRSARDGPAAALVNLLGMKGSTLPARLPMRTEVRIDIPLEHWSRYCTRSESLDDSSDSQAIIASTLPVFSVLYSLFFSLSPLARDATRCFVGQTLPEGCLYNASMRGENESDLDFSTSPFVYYQQLSSSPSSTRATLLQPITCPSCPSPSLT